MSKKICFLMICMMMFLVACGSEKKIEKSASTQNDTESSSFSKEDNEHSEEETISSDEELVQTESKSLVVYFSATGNTEKIATTISEVMSADLYEIIPVESYSDDDLDYNDSNCRANIEQNDKTIRPEINGAIPDWDQYDTVFIGHPIWWGEEPRIMDTFVESYDFTGKTVTTFCTSGSSGIGNSGKNMEGLAGTGTWLAGQRFSNNVSKDELIGWISDLGIGLE